MAWLELKSGNKQFTDALDRIFTHKVWGYPIFFVFIWIMFVGTFRLGAYPMHWIGTGISSLSDFLSSALAESMLKDLLIGGIISGIGGVIVFLPNILLLFFFISLMEDTGYMARAVYLMDKVMHRIGLHGKSFIPMIMGFGCNVPAILATRSIENRDSRLITILINPFFSCSARLPVYVLLIGAFFPRHSGTMLFLIYLIGVVLGVLTALVLKRTLFRTEHTPYEKYLPSYRIPPIGRTLRNMWANGLSYLKKISGVILIATIVIWALGYFPQKNAEIHEKSYIGRIGKWIEPALHPLGFDWKMGISLLTGISAKEIVVSTMGVLYQADPGPKESTSSTLIERLHSQVYTSGPKAGQQVFTPLVAFAFMVFILIYFPCIGTIATISKMSDSWKWGAFTVVYSTLLAWVMAFLIYQVGSLVL
jgi:ferrous iron transport protein B